MKRALRILLGVTLLALLALGGLVAWVAGTPGGSARALAVAAALAGERFSFESASGTLDETLEVRGLSVRLPAFSLDAARAGLRWRPYALLDGELHVRFARLADVTLRIAGSPADPAATRIEPPAFPALPLTVRIDALDVDGLLVENGTTRHALERVHLALRLDARHLSVSDLLVDAADFELEGGATLSDARMPLLEAQIEARSERAGEPLVAKLDLNGPLDRLTLGGQLDGSRDGTAFAARVAGTVSALADPPRASLTAEVAPLILGEPTAPRTIKGLRLEVTATPSVADVDLRATVEGVPPGERTIEANVHAVREAAATPGADAAVRVELRWQAVAPDGGARLAGSGSARLEQGTLRFRTVLDAPYVATLEGRLASVFDAPVLEATARWDPFELALPDRAPVALAAGALNARGPLHALAFDGETGLSIEPVGDIALNWRGRAGPAEVTLEAVNAALLGGTAALNGTVSWAPAPRAAFRFRGEGIDVAEVLALSAPADDPAARQAATDGLPPTRLALSGEGQVALEDGSPVLALTLDELSGVWRGHALHARANVHARPGAVSVRRATFALGDNRARADVEIAQTLSGDFELALAELGQFGTGVEGRLDAAGRMSGALTAPAVSARFDGEGLRYAAWSAASVAGTAAFDLAVEAPLEVAVTARRVSHGDRRVDALDVKLDGTTADHTLAMVLDAAPRRIELEVRGGLAGGLNDGRWTGVVQALDADTGRAGRWTLVAPAAVTVDRQRLDVEALCVANGEAHGCVTARELSRTGGTAAVTVDRLPLALAQDYLPASVTLEGHATLRANVEQRDGAPVASGYVGLADATVSLDIDAEGDGKITRVPVRAARAELTLDPTRLASTVVADVDGLVAISGRFDYALDGTRAMDGRLVTRTENLAWLGEFAPLLAGSRGAAEVIGTFAGSLDAPSVSVDVRLTEGSLFVPPSGTRVSSFEARLRTPAGQRLTLAASAAEGEGRLAIDGELALDPASGWPGEIRVTGTNFPVVRLPDAEADASPDLNVRFGDGQVELTGTLTIPRVAVSVLSLPESAVSVSPDEVIMREAAADDAADAGTATGDFLTRAVSGDVELVLGDAVAIEAAGLSARVTGGLRWTKQRGDSLGRGEGRLSIVDGSYVAYGQQLTIDRGHLIFAGAIDNPALDVRAVRPDVDVTAGLRVTGFMTDPSFGLFSNPAMADSEILSWIVTGHGLSDASSGEAGIIARAALSLGAERSSIVTSQVQDAFGLDELSVNTGATARETSFIAGKRLTPKLSVRSDFNPFDRLWSFFLNYKLTDAWSVEAESGQRQGADLIYGVERDTLIPQRWFD